MSRGNRWVNGNTELNNAMIPKCVSFSPLSTSIPPVVPIPSPNHPIMAYQTINAVIGQSFVNFSQLPIPNGCILPITPFSIPLLPFPTIIPWTNYIQTQSPAQNTYNTNQLSQNTFTTVQQQQISPNDDNNDTSASSTDSKQDENSQPHRPFKQAHKLPSSSSQQREHQNSNKKGKKGKTNNNQHVYTYQPPQESRVHKNITIPHAFKKKIASAMKMDFDKLKCHLDHKTANECKCDGVYLWVDILIGMQFHDENCSNDATKCYPLTEEIFVIIKENTKTDNCDIGNYRKPRRWKMKEKLYTKQMIMQIYNLRENQLSIPVRKSPRYNTQLMQKEAIQSVLKNPENITKIISYTKWCKIKVFSKLNNKQVLELKLTQATLQNYLRTNGAFKNQEVDLIPILLFTDHNYSIHHVVIVKINGSDVGISLIYDNSSQTVKVTGIHVNKEMIHIQHQWIALDNLGECNHKCLNEFVSHIDHLRIGNVKEDENKIKSLRKAIQIMTSNVN